MSLLALVVASTPLSGYGSSLRAKPLHHSVPKFQLEPFDASKVAGASKAQFSNFTSSLAGLSAASTGTSDSTPRIFFLFMAVDKVNNWEIWRRFFAEAPADSFRALVHCKTDACKKQFQKEAFMTVTPTVPASYCADLVSPMNKLLETALLQGPGTYQDKFVFVSDSTLPAKSFAQVYMTLTQRKGSDFCVFPSREWADVPQSYGNAHFAIKVHQWVVLTRAHALTSVDSWSRGIAHNLAQQFHLNEHVNKWGSPVFGDSHNYGCLDEFWHLSAIYGTLPNVNKIGAAEVNAPGFTNGPLVISATAGWQGSCDTFAMWSNYLKTPHENGKEESGKNPFYKLYVALDPLSVPHESDHRPGFWDAISTGGLRAIRDSDFLFVRKFVENPLLVDGAFVGMNFSLAFSKIVLSQ